MKIVAIKKSGFLSWLAYGWRQERPERVNLLIFIGRLVAFSALFSGLILLFLFLLLLPIPLYRWAGYVGRPTDIYKFLFLLLCLIQGTLICISAIELVENILPRLFIPLGGFLARWGKILISKCKIDIILRNGKRNKT